MCCDDAFLETAASIGDRIASDAIWHDGRCSWVGATDEPTVAHRVEMRALGPDLYGGTAGHWKLPWKTDSVNRPRHPWE